MVAIQESERMNILTAEMKRSLAELDLGLRGDLTMSEPMERLMHALAADSVPASWRNLAYPSLRPLGSWLANVQVRAQTPLHSGCCLRESCGRFAATLSHAPPHTSTQPHPLTYALTTRRAPCAGAGGTAQRLDGRPLGAQGRLALRPLQPSVLPHRRHADDGTPQRLAA